MTEPYLCKSAQKKSACNKGGADLPSGLTDPYCNWNYSCVNCTPTCMPPLTGTYSRNGLDFCCVPGEGAGVICKKGEERCCLDCTNEQAASSGFPPCNVHKKSCPATYTKSYERNGIKFCCVPPNPADGNLCSKVRCCLDCTPEEAAASGFPVCPS